MNARWVAVAAVALAAGLLLWAAVGWGMKAARAFAYPVDPSRPYGPRWRNRRPPGLPAAARKASVPGAALPHVKRIARELVDEADFAAAAVRLVLNESSGAMGLPANTFDARPEEQRGGRPRITAWGAYQYNAPAWRRATGDRSANPWDATSDEELRVPLREYAKVWTDAREAGADSAHAERAVRLWHMAPALVRAYIRDGARRGFTAAWASVTWTTRSGRSVRDVIDAKLSGVTYA